ncbi:MAG: Piwi domain-containing protein [Promethearchaeota archaeon]
MDSNLFISREVSFHKVKVPYYSIDSTISPDDYYRIVKGAEWRLFNKGFYPATLGNNLVFLGSIIKPPEILEVDRHTFSLSKDKIILNSIDHSYALSNIIRSALRRQAFSKGYTGPEGQKYYKKNPYKTKFFAFHEAFYLEAEVFPDGKVGVWLDPTTKWKWHLKDLIDSISPEERDTFYEQLVGKKVKYPSVRRNQLYKGTITEVIPRAYINYEFTINGDNYTIYDFWTKTSENHRKWLVRNNIILNPEGSPIVMVQIPNLKFSIPYPIEVLELVIDITDPLIPSDAFEEKKIQAPLKRINETFNLYDQILKQGLDLGSVKLTFSRELYNWNISPYGTVISLKAPQLQFGNNKTIAPLNSWKDPDIKNGMLQFGPVDKKERIPVSFIGPSSEKDNFRSFIKYLNLHARKLHLGTFELEKIFPIDRNHPDRYLRICQSVGKQLENQITFVVLPTFMTTKTYHAAKRGLGKNYVKSVMIQWNTYKKLLSASSQGRLSFENYNIALKAYGRFLECGEAIWHLKNPAGGLIEDTNNYFLGFDVSRSPESRKEAAAYAAVCDNYGKVLYKSSIDSHRGENVIAEILSDWFFEIATSTHDEIGSEKKIDCMYLFKDGSITFPQVKEYENGSVLAKERLMEEHLMTNDSDIKTIAVIKRGLHRFYGDEKQRYRVNYSGLIRSPKEALLITSRPRIGTAATTRIELTHQLISNTDISQIAKMFNDLRYLDWNSLFSQPKTILPLHIVQNLAKLSKEDVIVPYDPR